MHHFYRTLFVSMLILAVSTADGLADDRMIPGRLDRETRDALAAGLSVRFESAGQPADVRADRLAALCVPAGQPSTPFLSPGPFRATFTGYLKNRLRETFRFHLQGQGQAILSVNGQKVLVAGPGRLEATEPVAVELAKGYNSLAITYDSPPTGDAVLRVFWEGADFPAEPLPADSLLHDTRNTELTHGLSQRLGRALVGRLHCARCHSLPAEIAQAAETMPELQRDAPSLADSSRRLEPAWVAAWVAEPARLRNQVRMPDLLDPHSADDRQTAADLAAFLAESTTSNPRKALQKSAEILSKGEFLYEYRGCIACHRFTPPEQPDEDWNRVSLHYVAAKYRPGALVEFLQDSRRHYQWSRMPQFRLTLAEADALAVYLREHARGTLEAPAAGDARRGKQAFTERGCVACHQISRDAQPAVPSVSPLLGSDRSSGCLADSDARPQHAPNFRLTAEQRSGLIEFLKSNADSLARVVPAEFAQRHVLLLNCTACHERDVTEARLPTAIGLEGNIGQLPDEIPPLTWAGEKLDVAWSTKLLAGDLEYRLRSHLRAHMPGFPTRAKWLAVGLSHQHGYSADVSAHNSGPPYDAEAAQIGKEVIAMQTGLACNRCHAIGEVPAQAPEQALSTNLSFARDRLRHDYYLRWMLFPQRIDRRTRMIKFAPDAKTTPLDFYDHDARQQFEAVWHYLRDLQTERNVPSSK